MKTNNFKKSLMIYVFFKGHSVMSGLLFYQLLKLTVKLVKKIIRGNLS